MAHDFPSKPFHLSPFKVPFQPAYPNPLCSKPGSGRGCMQQIQLKYLTHNETILSEKLQTANLLITSICYFLGKFPSI